MKNMIKNKRWIAISCLLLLLTGVLSPADTTALLQGGPTLAQAKESDEADNKVVTYDKKVPYATIKKKLYAKRTRFLQYESSSAASALMLYGFFYKSWPISGYGYGVDQQSDVIILYPMIRAVQQGGTSKLSVGIKFRCNTQVINLTSRKFKSMTLAGGGIKVSVNGKTTSRNKPMGQFVRNRIITTGTFTISRNTAPHLALLEKVKKIFDSDDPRVIFKDTTHNKTYKCSISPDSAGSMTSILYTYESLLKNYKKTTEKDKEKE